MFKCLNTLAGRQGCAQPSDQIDDMMCPLTWVTATVDTKVRTNVSSLASTLYIYTYIYCR